MHITPSNSRNEIRQDPAGCGKSPLCLRARMVAQGFSLGSPCRKSRFIHGALAPEVRFAASTTFPHSLPDGETGQAFVELALVLPMLLLIIVGAAELGRLAYAAIEVNNAARAGVAYAAQSHITANDTNSIQLAATKEAATQDAADISGLTVTVSQSCSCESSAGVMTSFASCDKTVTNLTTCPSPSRIVEYVQVQTSASVNTLFHLPGIPNTVTMQGNANMRVEQ